MNSENKYLLLENIMNPIFNYFFFPSFNYLLCNEKQLNSIYIIFFYLIVIIKFFLFGLETKDKMVLRFYANLLVISYN